MNKKVLIGSLSQESNSFSPLGTRYEDFVICRGQAVIERLAAAKVFLDAGYDIVPSIYAAAIPGGTLSLEAYRRMAEELLACVPLDSSLDGVWLNLHGAMDVSFIGSGEALLVSMIRDRIGSGVPISIAMDMHANHSDALVKLANIICGFKTAPHTDGLETNILAARLLIRAIEENCLPRCDRVRIPILLPGEKFVTTGGPGQEIISRLPDIEKEPGVWCASFFAGMPWVDCPQCGASVLVSGTGDLDGGMAAAAKLGRTIWDMRDRFAYQALTLPPREALDRAAAQENGPVFISDSGDNVTAGAAGDNSYFLGLLMQNPINRTLVAGLTDARAVQVCAAAGLGGTVDLLLGGSIDTQGSMKTRVTGQVLKLRKSRGAAVDGTMNNAADGAVVRTPAIDIMIQPEREFVTTEQDILDFDISPLDYRIVVVKLGYLFPDLVRISRCSIMALTPGSSSLNIRELKYRKVQRPIYPLDSFT